MIKGIVPVPRFGARLITPEPIPVRFVKGDVSGYVPARVWELEKKDVKPALNILKTWKEAGQIVSAEGLGKLLKKSPIETLAAHPVSPVWLAFGLTYLSNYLVPVLFYPLGALMSILLYMQTHQSLENGKVYAMTVGDRKVKKRWGGGKTISFVHMTHAANINYISRLETAYWNQRPSGQKDFRFFGTVEGMVYAAMREQGINKLEWVPSHPELERYYKRILQRETGIKPANLLAYKSFPKKGVKKMVAILEERYANTPLDANASRIAAQALNSVPEPEPLVPLPPRSRQNARQKT